MSNSLPKNELVTLPDGAFRVGVPLSTVRAWRSKGGIRNLSPHGHPAAYSLRALMELAAVYHERKRRLAAKQGGAR